MINVYASKNRDLKYIKPMWTEQKGEIKKSRMIVGDINRILSETNRTKTQHSTDVIYLQIDQLI